MIQLTRDRCKITLGMLFVVGMRRYTIRLLRCYIARLRYSGLVSALLVQRQQDVRIMSADEPLWNGNSDLDERCAS